MEEKFDYAKAVKELEEIAAKVEDPATKLDDIDALVGRSNALLKACREYLRTVKEKIDKLVERIHSAGRLVLADISTYEEGMSAADIGADAISTTLSGYTSYSPQLEGPDVDLVARLAKDLTVPVFAEGRINTPADIGKVMEAGAYAPIVGSAITRPQLITAKFAKMLQG